MRLKNNKIMNRILTVLICSLVVVSCGTRKNAVNDKAIKNAGAKKVLRYYKKSEPEFKTIYARMKGSLDDGKEKQSINISMRMQKDSVIWISAKLAGIIPMAKLKITPSRVQFYEKINNQKFDGDFRLLSDWLGATVDYQTVQSLLLGELLMEINPSQYDFEEKDEEYRFSTIDEWDVNNVFVVDNKNFRVQKQLLEKSYPQQKLEIKYPSYQEKEGFLFPEVIKVLVNQKGKESKIDIKYRSLELNKSVNFPFKMPSGYDEIEI